MSGTVADALVWWARTVPDLCAVDFDGEQINYRDLNRWAEGAAAALLGMGVHSGDRVAIVGSNSAEWCVAALAAFKIGAIVAPFNHRMVTRELAELVADCEPRVVLCDEALVGRVDAIPATEHAWTRRTLEDTIRPLRDCEHSPVPGPDHALDDPTAIVYTSGTTGKPKGVIFTHRMIGGVTHEWRLIEEVRPNSLKPLLVLPLFSAAGIIWGLCRVVVDGGTLLLQPGFDPRRALDRLVGEQATTLNGPPIIFEQIAMQPDFGAADLAALTTAHVGGARVPVELLEKWNRRGVSLRQIYGQTEIGGSATAMPRGEAALHPEKCGRGGIFTKIRIVDDNDNDVPAGVPGQILLQGPGMTPGYWGNEAATAAALIGGWLHTGDLGVVDTDGYLTYIERIKDLIISGGLNIAPAEIEQVVQSMPGIEEVAVIAVRDEKFGETPAALLRSSTKISAQDVVEWCNERLADYKVPRYLVFVDDDLPRMASGKIDKRELRQTYARLPETNARVR
jgi:fatty-acyl-CoA synthase